MHAKDTVIPMLTLYVLIQDALGGTFPLMIGSDGKQPLLLLHHDEISILVQNLQQRMAELMLVLFVADLHFHSRL